MKEKSQQKGAYAERWKTPVSSTWSLYLEAVLQTVSHTHFFFFKDDEKFPKASKVKNFENKRRDIHVLTIGRNLPYRLTEEGYAHPCITKYLPMGRRKRRKPFRTWRLWGTSFIKELDEGYALSGYANKRNENLSEYLIITGDEWIEFIAGIPRWNLLRNVTLKEAVRHYFSELTDPED